MEIAVLKILENFLENTLGRVLLLKNCGKVCNFTNIVLHYGYVLGLFPNFLEQIFCRIPVNSRFCIW